MQSAQRQTGHRLPRGRHDLTREQIEEHQRIRILMGFAEAMADDGYARTPVSAVIGRAGVSRETYYRLFADKLDGFLAALDLIGEILLLELDRAVDIPGTRLEKVGAGVQKYLEILACHRGHARLFLVEAFAAGPAAIDRRSAVQLQIAERLAEVLDVESEPARVTCRIVVAAVSSMIVRPLVAADNKEITDLGPVIMAEIGRYQEAGLFD